MDFKDFLSYLRDPPRRRAFATRTPEDAKQYYVVPAESRDRHGQTTVREYWSISDVDGSLELDLAILTMASAEELHFNEPHKPQQKAVDAFNDVLHTIKAEIRKSRNDWDKHEPRMWRRARGISDEDLTSFTIKDDLVLVRSAPTSYGTIIIGKIRLPKVNDADGEPGYVHVRIHDPPNRGTEDIIFHSLFTEEVRPIQENPPTDYCAIHTRDKPLDVFNE